MMIKDKMEITITKGNMKLPKETLNVSLTPIKSCPNSTEKCRKHCYALKAYKQYPNVKKAWDNNLELSKTKDFEKLIIEKLNKFKNWKQFRISVSGDFYDNIYFEKWCRIAKKFPDKIFYAYTKAKLLTLNLKPNNFILIRSDDDNWFTKKDLKSLGYNGKAKVVEKDYKLKKGEFLCNMSCKECNECYTKPNKWKNIVFIKH